MKPLGEVNLRKRMDPAVHEAARRAGGYTAPWQAHGRCVYAGDYLICECELYDSTAQHIADCHNHFLTLYNMLLFRERSEEDLDEPEQQPGRAKSQIPATARSRRFPVPAERPR